MHDDLCIAEEGAVADELFGNSWIGAAHLHPDLTAEELASMLLDGYDIGDQP